MRLKKYPENLMAWLFSAPAVLLLGLCLLLPFLMAVGLSFTNQRLLSSPLNPTQFIGLDNYQRILESDSFWQALRNNLTFVAVVVPVQTSLSLGMAMLVNQAMPLMALFRTIFFVPVATVMSVVAVIWTLLYNSPEGLLNSLVSSLSFGAIREVNWLDNPQTAFGAIMVLSIWQGAGYQMLIFLAGLQSIPTEMYEAAEMDGANPLQQFLFVTLPQLRNTLIFVVLTTTILAFQLFDQNYVMTKGGPADSTMTMVMYLVQEGFQRQRIGVASAVSVVFFVLVLCISLLQRKLLPEERAVS